MADQLSEKDAKIRQLEDEVFRLKNAKNEAAVNRRAEGSALLQLEHVKQDNERLIEMLS